MNPGSQRGAVATCRAVGGGRDFRGGEPLLQDQGNDGEVVRDVAAAALRGAWRGQQGRGRQRQRGRDGISAAGRRGGRQRERRQEDNSGPAFSEAGGYQDVLEGAVGGPEQVRDSLSLLKATGRRVTSHKVSFGGVIRPRKGSRLPTGTGRLAGWCRSLG